MLTTDENTTDDNAQLMSVHNCSQLMKMLTIDENALNS